ncbi:MAG: hypothetical protein HUU50_09070 [Candidatus Brocadiae bacterium]|nr:hypothetical protein [Candidatus Brocadiia bacterium]
MRHIQAFIAMPFNPVFLPVWKIIKKACEKNEIMPVRVDQLAQVDDIHKTIFEEIEKSQIIIVDFTGDKISSIPNPNVVTEATHAKELKKNIVILTQSTDALPFDWRTHRALVYQNNNAGLEYLSEVLAENLESLKRAVSHEVKEKNKQSILHFKKSLARYSNDIYEGEIKDGKRNGYGIFYYLNGNQYEGEWKDDKRNGYGIEYKHDILNIYQGEWKDDKRNGYGIEYSFDHLTYEGEWKDDKKNGHGIEYYTNGEKYEGEIKDNRRNGHGTYYYANGGKYEGNWINGKKL